MAPPSPRSSGVSRGRTYTTAPRSCPPNTDASPDTTHSITCAPDSLLSRLEAVDKFALYGRQHAHVDHLSGIEEDTTITLQSTMLLQEDGQLAAKLDDVMYLVDGLLKPVKTPRARLAQTRSILELVQLVQDPQILQALELSSQRRSIQNKLKLLLLRLKDTTDEMSRLSLAVLVYFLSKSAAAEDYFDDQVLAAIVHALKQEQGGEQVEKKSTEVSDATSLKKCLKRKQNTKKSVKPETLETSTTQVLDECCRMQLDEILQGHEVFYAGDELQVSVVSTLCAALHNLMQLNGPSSSSTRVSQRCQQPDDATEDSFQRIRARKRQLLRNGGLDVLAVDLANQVYALQALLPSTSTQEISVECARCLHDMNMVLRVFDQATFLTEEVQQYVSKQRNCFVVLLKLTQLLGELSWGVEARKRWEAELSRMALAVEVLLSALRVLLNLTHHNNEAASHVHALGGMQLLVNTFSRLWGEITAMGKHSTQKKWEFDACLLLLSVMVNSIELSEENRDALAESQVALSRDDGAMTLQAGCGLFVRFFMATLESFKHLIDVPDAQDAGGAFSVEESDDWSPEDVLLGGCTSLLLGYLMKDSTANSTAVLEAMPDGSPRLLLRSLGVFVAFHSQLGALTPEVAKSVLLIEKVLKSCEESESGTVESEVLETIAAKAVPGVREQQHADTIAAAKSQETDVDFSSTLSTEDLVKSQRSEVPPRGLRPRAMKNLCSNLDDSDEDNEQVQEEEAMLKGPQTSLEVGMRTPPRSPGRKLPRVKFLVKTPVSAAKGKRECRSSPIAVLPDGSLSSPVVARLLKRTRQLVEEFDAEFGQMSQSSPAKKNRNTSERGAATEKPPSLGMVFTMDVTCRDNGSDGLALSQDIGEEKATNNGVVASQEVRTAVSLKRKVKPTRDPSVKSAIASFDLFPSSTPPSTPLRVKKGTALLQTPTRAGRSPDVYRQSPSLNLTPTKASPSTPLRMKKTSKLLKTPTRNGLKESPMSVGQHRRKAKAVRAPTCTGASSIFDFME
ncbi:hypothetical protein PC129_g21515 [Phytophthora cactorum]|uniref:Uncharacterized protein n=2 Tax=Phytophthora cactorum TaxID=29920 RepID=A0A329S4Y6_9STRA|nr:hypothetical protein Pcac1_g21423 [Phytophthora cactorum]KAG2796323.1 hypothetical protein PC111_g21774 [Phytophthora cactorum]KAG2796587.1 hypothetical protein PC112_g22139 [Phytophthora cactorum]KAG2824478.1 hypothetical protein PC113_g22030 [Phytophthora cactorum]KAG2882567.1 hypothetical protein PC115_g21909 [Phytophthora cactorum]